MIKNAEKTFAKPIPQTTISQTPFDVPHHGGQTCYENRHAKDCSYSFQAPIDA